MRSRDVQGWLGMPVAAFVEVWETAKPDPSANKGDAHVLRANYLRALGVPLTRYSTGQKGRTHGEPRRIAWSSPFSVTELQRLADLALALSSRALPKAVEEAAAEDVEPSPPEVDAEVDDMAAKVEAAFADLNAHRAFVQEQRNERRRARRAAGVARGLRARDVH